MKKIPFASIVLVSLLCFTNARADIGAAASPGAGFSYDKSAASVSDKVKLHTDFEAMLYYAPIDYLRLDLPVLVGITPQAHLTVRPGLRAILPLIGVFGRAGVSKPLTGDQKDMGLVLGAGWQLTLLDTLGIYFEGDYEPLLTQSPFRLSFRAGALINF